MKKILRTIILPLLHLVRKILTVLKNHCLPLLPIPDPPPPLPRMFAMYDEEEKINCYNHFKKYFKNSIFLDKDEIREYSIKEAIENDKNLSKYYLEFGVYIGVSINFF